MFCRKKLSINFDVLFSRQTTVSVKKWLSYSAIEAKSLERMMAVNPVDTELLLNTQMQKRERKRRSSERNTINLFRHVQTYKSHSFKEKKFVFEPEVARDICQNILQHSQADSNAPLIETDGGLYLIARQFREVSPRPIIVCERDKAFTPLHSKLLDFDNVSVVDLHYIKLHQKMMDDEEIHDCAFADLTSKFRNGWSNPKPAYTLFSTIPHAFIKYLCTRLLCAWDGELRHLRGNEYFDMRPEYFVMVPPKTILYYIHSHPYSRSQPFYHLFHLMFDFQVIGKYPVHAYMPWSRTKETVSKRPWTKQFHEDQDKLILMKLRPKVDIGLEKPEEFKAHDLMFLLSCVRRSTRFSPSGNFISMMEKFSPGVGYDLIKKAGMTCARKATEVKSSEIIPVLNIVRAQKDYHLSHFVTSAKMHALSMPDVFKGLV